jgi:hypothetical protein
MLEGAQSGLAGFNSLAAPLRVVAFDHGGPGRRRNGGGIVGTVVCDHNDAEVRSRPVQRPQTRNGLRDIARFVMGGDDDVEGHASRLRPGCTQGRRQQRLHQQVSARQDRGERNQAQHSQKSG